MADLSSITLPNGSTYNLKDSVARATMINNVKDSDGETYTGAVVEGLVEYNQATGNWAHAEGGEYYDPGNGEEVLCFPTIASGQASHAEGSQTTASGHYAHAEGMDGTTASGNGSHAEGSHTEAMGIVSHAEGVLTTAKSLAQHVFGMCNSIDSAGSTSERGTYVEIVGNGTFKTSTDGKQTVMTPSNARTLDWSGNERLAGSITLGAGTSDVTSLTASELKALKAIDSASIIPTNVSSPSEGQILTYDSTNSTWINSTMPTSSSTSINNVKDGTGTGAVVEGNIAENTATGNYSHAEGTSTHSTGQAAHAEGRTTTASATGSHAEGVSSEASAWAAHAEGSGSHAYAANQHVVGKYNADDSAGTYVEIVGNGSASTRSNARTLDWSGNEWVAGSLSAGGGSLTLGNVTLSASELTTIKQISSSSAPMASITWANLKSKRDNGQLVPGIQYRITDYVCTTTQEESQVASHPFDIIVTADSASALNENARACLHSGDTYYSAATSGANLNAWEVKYCIDNDTSRFAWVDGTNGKGVIYYLKDEKGNECPYDFKQIQFKRYKITACSNNTYLVNNYSTQSVNSYLTISDSDFIWAYTFSLIESNVVYDSSIYAISSDNKVYNNVIKEYVPDTGASAMLNNNVLISAKAYLNTFEKGCYSNTFYETSYRNTLGCSCHDNFFGNFSIYNSLGPNSYNNVIGRNAQNNVIGSYAYNNFFCNTCEHNTIGTHFQGNFMNGSFRLNTVGDYCHSNNFGKGCMNNTIGNGVWAFQMVASGSSTGTTSRIQYYNVLAGTKGDASVSPTVTLTLGNTASAFIGMDSSGNVKVWKPADLVQ